MCGLIGSDSDKALFTGFEAEGGAIVSATLLVIWIQRQKWFKVTGRMICHPHSSSICQHFSRSTRYISRFLATLSLEMFWTKFIFCWGSDSDPTWELTPLYYTPPSRLGRNTPVSHPTGRRLVLGPSHLYLYLATEDRLNV